MIGIRAFRSSLSEANKANLSTVGFPAISTGVYGYPKDEAAEVSLKAVGEAIGNVREVHFVLFGRDMLEEYIDAAVRLFGQPLKDTDDDTGAEL